MPKSRFANLSKRLVPLNLDEPSLHTFVRTLEAKTLVHYRDSNGYHSVTWTDHEDAHLSKADVISSEHIAAPGRHAILLDLDFHAATSYNSYTKKTSVTVPPWGLKLRTLRKLDRCLRRAGLAGIADVDTTTPVPHPILKGRFLAELTFSGQVWVTESKTPGHHHLYVNVEGGLPAAQYAKLRKALYKAHIIEKAHTWGDSTYLRPPAGIRGRDA